MREARPAEDAVDSVTLRRAFGAFATGVTVITVGGATPHGMTANSFTAVSLEPPLALVCIEKHAVMHGCLQREGRFGVSVLAYHQAAVARHFADRRRPLGLAQFGVVGWRPGRCTGAPLIVGAVAHFEFARHGAYEAGDHTIFVGRVLRQERVGEDPPLLFANGRFDQLAQIEPVTS